MQFRIRLDKTADANAITVQEFVTKYNQYVVVLHEVNDNPHYHLLITDSMCMSVQTMRMRVKRYFKVEKASDYSVKECSNDRELEYIQYLFNTKHGNKYTLMSYTGYDSNIIDDCIARAQEVSDEFKASVEKRKKKSTISVYDLAEEVKELMEGHEHVMQESPEDWYRMASLKAIQICKKHRKGMDYNMIVKIVTTYTGIVDEKALASKVERYFSDRYK